MNSKRKTGKRKSPAYEKRKTDKYPFIYIIQTSMQLVLKRRTME